jgi:hypothetical protein
MRCFEIVKRRRYTAIAFGLLCGVSAAGLFLRLASREPFDFLAWQVPVTANDRPSSDGRWIVREYAFPADFEQLNHRANAELARHGFSLAADDRKFGPRAVQYERRGPDGWRMDFVILYQDMHYKLPQHGEPYSVVGYDEPGWVSVQIHLEFSPSRLEVFWRNVKQFCGF